jgi:NAD(P)-dependent dehydrogenase (short-subunit alcohol dehydrogenase family)
MGNHPLLRPNSVVLVSGGARGITAECVIHLAQRSGSKFILLGRSSLDDPIPAIPDTIQGDVEIKRWIAQDLQKMGELPVPAKIQKIYRAVLSHREIHKTLKAVDDAGSVAEYVSVDISNKASLQERLAPAVHRLGPITGIIHGAGSLADKMIEKKTEKDFETVYSPKVTGLENMLACVSPKQLDFLVLFSSIVGVFGNVGQSDYAIANDILNKSAQMIKYYHPECRVVSINWGPWDGGMVTPEIKKIFQERNMEIIPLEEGARILMDELSSPSGAVVKVVGSIPSMPLEPQSEDLKSYEIRRKLRLEINPFLHDHVIGDFAVLPATCSASWVINTCEELYPGYTFFNLQDLRILKGIVFDQTLAEEYVLDLKETEKCHGDVTLSGLIWSKDQRGRTRYHYKMSVRLVDKVSSAPLVAQPVFDVSEEESIPGKVFYENGTLFHGPSFQGIDRVLFISPGKVIIRCVLPKVDDIIQGQFPVRTSNPFIYDAIVQSLLVWTHTYYQSPCLPCRMDKLEQYRPIPFGVPCYVTMEVTAQSPTSVTGSLMVQDMDGVPYVQIVGLEGTISPALNRFIGKRPEDS